LNSIYGSERELQSLLKDMKKNKLPPMADIVINHRIGSTHGIGDLYNHYNGMPMPWDEHAITCDSHIHPFPLEIEVSTQI
jgi:alpha-amylase